MKKLFVIIVLMSFLKTGAFSENKPFVSDSVKTEQRFSQEVVFVHYNAPLLFSGEMLYYKFYCKDLQSGKLSDLSKIGYLELINEDREVIFKHLVDLEDGAGQGDFFIPVTVPSGNYKLVGFTRWMTNATEKNFFEGNLVIINPYQSEQKIVKPGDNSFSPGLDNNSAGTASAYTANSSSFKLVLPEKRFNTRSKVNFSVQGPQNSVPADLSVSVRRIENFPQVSQPTSISVTESSEILRKTAPTTVTALPDLRGQLITGRIVPKGGQTLSLSGKSIGVSMPGEDFFLRVAGTDPNGKFHFNLEQHPNKEQAHLQVLGAEKDAFLIELDPLPSVDYESLSFPEFYITPNMEQAIKERSIFNQIENNYLESKRDSVLSFSEKIPFYGSIPEKYNLDDYTRFPSIRETFVEIINLARVRKTRSGEYNIDIIMEAPRQELKSLVIVDGLLVQDHGKLVDFDARKIQSIGVIRSKYFLGPQVFAGVLVVESIEGDFHTTQFPEYVTVKELERPQLRKIYTFPVYDGTRNNERIPDFRTQLFWKPEVQVNAGTQDVEFYTSDVPGEYEIIIEGFTNNGLPVYLRETIRVN